MSENTKRSAIRRGDKSQTFCVMPARNNTIGSDMCLGNTTQCFRFEQTTCSFASWGTLSIIGLTTSTVSADRVWRLRLFRYSANYLDRLHPFNWPHVALSKRCSRIANRRNDKSCFLPHLKKKMSHIKVKSQFYVNFHQKWIFFRFFDKRFFYAQQIIDISICLSCMHICFLC